MTTAQFDAVSLHETGQRAILGAILMPKDPAVHELAVTLVRAEPYHPDMAIAILKLVRTHVQAPIGTAHYYFPTFEQQACATESAGRFANEGFSGVEPRAVARG